jgi:DNA-binding transcriptional LysR family regulator
MLEWDDLRYFLAFARAGSMQAAAKALGVNQSTVQRRIAELEERIGRRLVERHLGGYRLTELGGELRPAAEAVDSAVGAFERRLAACDKGLTGTIRVTCGTILANRLQQTHLIDLFHKRNPGLRVELIISDREFDLPKEADIAIRGGEPRDESLVGRKIAEAPWAVYASRAYVERHGRPERPADIERHFVVDCVAKHPGAQWLRSVAPRATIASCADNHPGLILAVSPAPGSPRCWPFKGTARANLCVSSTASIW